MGPTVLSLLARLLFDCDCYYNSMGRYPQSAQARSIGNQKMSLSSRLNKRQDQTASDDSAVKQIKLLSKAQTALLKVTKMTISRVISLVRL